MGCISDTDPQPLLVRSHLGLYAICTVGIINNIDELIETYFSDHGHQFMAQSSGKVNVSELVAALINMKENLVEGILYAQEMIKGSITILLMTPDGILAARDRLGRLPVLVGKHPDGSLCVSFESFAYHKLGYEDAYELGPREIVALTRNGYETVSPPGKGMKICGFLWTYYGYPNSNYEGVNVEVMRYRNGEIMARDEVARGRLPKVDYVAGVPDSGVPHAIGFANRSGKPFARPFVKYTPTWPRSFTPANQEVRCLNQVAFGEIVRGKQILYESGAEEVIQPENSCNSELLPQPPSTWNLLARRTIQELEGVCGRFHRHPRRGDPVLRETVDFLYESGAEEVHMRSACPPIMYSCKYLNFSRGNSDMELLARRVIQELEGDEGHKHLDEYSDSSTERGQCLLKSICEKFGFDSLGYQSLDGVLEAIGIDRDKVCTYCWNGKE